MRSTRRSAASSSGVGSSSERSSGHSRMPSRATAASRTASASAPERRRFTSPWSPWGPGPAGRSSRPRTRRSRRSPPSPSRAPVRSWSMSTTRRPPSIPAGIEEAITQRTAAVVPVHLYGQCAPMRRDPLDLLPSRDPDRRGRGPGARGDLRGTPGGIARGDRGFQLLPLEESRRVRRRRDDHDGRPGARRATPPPAQLRGTGTLPPHGNRLQLPPRRDPGRDPSREAPPPGWVERGETAA